MFRGGRRKSDWFRNLLAHPEVEIILPGGALFARAEEVSDAAERLTVARQVLLNAGFAGFFEGYNPRTISDAALAEKISDLPVTRFTPLGLANGPFDPGGWGWIWGILLTLAGIFGLKARRRRK